MTTLGNRVAEYRKLGGLSAQDLADQAGAGLSRSVIANLESGRKADLPSAQVTAIAWALGISPIALLLDLGAADDPAAVDFGDGYTNRELAYWMTGDVLYGVPNEDGFVGMAQLVANRRLTSLRNLYRLNQRLAHLDRQIAHQASDEAKDVFRTEHSWVLEQIADEEQRLKGPVIGEPRGDYF